MLLELEMHGVSRREAYRQVLDHFPDRGELALALGDLHARAGAWQEALEVYEDLLHRGVAPPGLQGAVAAAYQQLGQSPQALAAFQLAVLQMPADPRLWNGLAAAAASVGDLVEARRATARVLELDPDNTHARANLERLGGR